MTLGPYLIPAAAPRSSGGPVSALAAVAALAASTALFARNDDVGDDSNAERATEDLRSYRRGPMAVPAANGTSRVGTACMTSSATLPLDTPRWYFPIAAPATVRCEGEAAGPIGVEPSRYASSSGGNSEGESTSSSTLGQPAPPPAASPPAPRAAVPSRTRRILHALRLADLPAPRTLTPSDPAFDYPALRAGLRRRAEDEVRLRSLRGEAVAARNSADPERIREVFGHISAVAYGEGVTPQEREDFLVRYGCTGWTDEILTYLVGLASDRGIVEIGAGNGQWARAIMDRHAELTTKQDTVGGAGNNNNYRKSFDFIIPYDDMTNLPLSPKVYHRHTQPFHENFHPNVRKCASHVDAVRKWESRGRVLVLVYPPPGPFAVETVRAYVDVYPDGNDTVVYVGEGRGGANADDDLFDYFLSSGDWTLVKTMDVRPSLGGKGYERMFVLRRSK